MNLLMIDPYEALRPLMNRYGATCSPRDFYWAVNQAYHTVEAHQYDKLHEAMFVGLEPVWHFLFSQAATHPSPKLRVLDVGAGTGLVGGFVEMHLASRVGSMTMLDPCEAMLGQCRRRAELFSFSCDFRHGDILELGPHEQFDLITVNSVLHHVVELPAFFARVRTLLAPQGWLLTAQDPRAQAASDSCLQARRKQWRQRHRRLARAVWSRCRQLVRRLLGPPHLSPLALETSHQLLQQQTIRQPMTMSSIYAVTDFHVPGQPGGLGKGLDLKAMAGWLPDFVLAASRTYQFHGVPWTGLGRGEQELESQWWAARDPHGELFASAWRRDLRP
jgi:ubiquinone/menaquinone biosynthesis C-methylase UbiE